MNDRRSQLAQISVFVLLVAIGVVGRWGQPDWCVTPMAAVGLMAGCYFRRLGIAVLVPLVAMGISDMLLARYDLPLVFLAVYASMTAPALLGRVLRTPVASKLKGLGRLALCASAPAVIFFLTTNFAVWATGAMYSKSMVGLVECYTAAIPFFRNMLAGDVAYTAALFGAAALAGYSPLLAERTQPAAA